MRIFHLLLLVFFAAIILTVAREPAGRVALVVFFTGLAECFFCTVAIMKLFQTVGAIGEADRPLAYLHAIVSSALVLLVTTVTMNGLLWIGVWLVQKAAD